MVLSLSLRRINILQLVTSIFKEYIYGSNKKNSVSTWNFNHLD